MKSDYKTEQQNSELEELRTLVRRICPDYPHKASGICSHHGPTGPASCATCWPNYKELIAEHIKVHNELYQELLELAGVQDTPNGRFGWKSALKIIKEKLASK